MLRKAIWAPTMVLGLVLCGGVVRAEEKVPAAAVSVQTESVTFKIAGMT